MRIELTSWNAHSHRHVYAPNWTWTAVPGVARYRVSLADQQGVVLSETTTRPEWDLADHWDRIGPGPLDLLIVGLDPSGNEICSACHRRFHKGKGFDGHEQVSLDLQGAVRRNLAYLLAPARDTVAEYEAGLPRSCWSSFEDSVTGERSRLAYPALHHPSFILCFLHFAERFPSDPLAGEARRQAARFGEWLLSHRQPAEWRYALFPYSTIQAGHLSGGLEGRNITVFRAARVGEAMLALYGAFQDGRYLDYACHLADVFARMQRDDGSWPYRVDPEDGAVVEDYTSDAITPARFLELLLAIRAEPHWADARDKAVGWMLDNPVRTYLWQGMYEDVGPQQPYTNLQNWDVNKLLRYLIHHRGENPSYLDIATELNSFIEDQFVLWQQEAGFVQCPTPVVFEQYRCYHPMEVHTGNWLLSLAALHQATGSSEYLTKGIAAANAIVRGQHAGGALSTWGYDQRFGRPLNAINWPGCNACASTALMLWDEYTTRFASGQALELGLRGI